jgi:hypothetical protein
MERHQRSEGIVFDCGSERDVDRHAPRRKESAKGVPSDHCAGQ